MTSIRSAHQPRSVTQRAVLASIALGGMLVPLNSTMLAVALPDVMRAFGVDLGAAGWLVSAYLITMAAFQLAAGRFGDRYGRRRVVLGAMAYFGLASLLAALAPSLPVLLFARVQQAVAGALVLTNGIALAFEVVPENQRGRDLGLLSAIVMLAAAAGPPLGGLLVDLATWRAIFWANLPIVAAALLFGWPAMPDVKGTAAGRLFDFRAIPALFRSQTFACANGAILFGNLGMYVLLLGIPIIISVQDGWSSVKTGLLLAVMSVTMAVATPFGGRLSDHVGRRMPSVVGSALFAAGMLPLALFGDIVRIPMLLAGLWLAGVGIGLSSASLQTAALESVDGRQAGLVTGVSSTSRYLGSILGTTILAPVLGQASAEATDVRQVFVVAAVAAGLSLLLSWGISDQGQPAALLSSMERLS